jgi:hypothetical protein
VFKGPEVCSRCLRWALCGYEVPDQECSKMLRCVLDGNQVAEVNTRWPRYTFSKSGEV